LFFTVNFFLTKLILKRTRSSQDGAGDGHALGEEDGGDGVDLNAMVESVGMGLVEPEIVISGQRVVDALKGDLVFGVVHVDLVVRSVLAVEVTEVVAELVGGVVDEIGHLVVVNSDDSLVQVSGKTVGGDAFIAVATAGDLVLAALGVLPLGAESGGGFIFAAGPLRLFKSDFKISSIKN
jgi:hypothetical protein